MKLFSILESDATAYEWSQRLVTLNFSLFLRELRREHFFQPGLSYLDLGCGTGFLRDHLPGSDYLGVDLNPAYIAAASRRRGAGFQVGDALDLGRISSRFDRVVAIGLLHHLNDAQVIAVLSGVCKCLKPDGELFILDALWPTGKNPVGRFLRQSDNGAYVRSLAAWETLLCHGFQPVALRPISQWPFDYVLFRAKSKITMSKT